VNVDLVAVDMAVLDMVVVKGVVSGLNLTGDLDSSSRFYGAEGRRKGMTHYLKNVFVARSQLFALVWIGLKGFLMFLVIDLLIPTRFQPRSTQLPRSGWLVDVQLSCVLAYPDTPRA
jgi:hypothetical protein